MVCLVLEFLLLIKTAHTISNLGLFLHADLKRNFTAYFWNLDLVLPGLCIPH